MSGTMTFGGVSADSRINYQMFSCTDVTVEELLPAYRQEVLKTALDISIRAVGET